MPVPTSGALLYLSNGLGVDIYTYPNIGYVENLIQISMGICVDAAGDIFFTDYSAAKVAEYTHGAKKPIQTLDDPAPNPVACAVDPITGNLAIANYAGKGLGADGSVAIFQSAQGNGTLYTAPKFFYYFACAYDAAGDLFIDGETRHFAPIFAELPSGSTQFIDIRLPKPLRNAPLLGGLFWDGTYVVMNTVGNNIVYRLRVSGSSASIAGSTRLRGAQDVYQFVIFNRRILAINNVIGSNLGTRIWKYPVGGKPLETLQDGSAGLAISQAPK